MKTSTRILLAALCVSAGACAGTRDASFGGEGASASASSGSYASQSSSGSHSFAAADLSMRDNSMRGDIGGRGIPMPEPARDPEVSAHEMPTPQMPIPVRDHGNAAHGSMGYMY